MEWERLNQDDIVCMASEMSLHHDVHNHIKIFFLTFSVPSRTEARRASPLLVIFVHLEVR